MKQVLLSVTSPTPSAPILMWVGDDILLGDTFLWSGRVCTVSAIYGTHLCPGLECRRSERARKNQQSGVVIDRSAVN